MPGGSLRRAIWNKAPARHQSQREARFPPCPPRAFVVSRKRSTSALHVPARSMKLSCFSILEQFHNEAASTREFDELILFCGETELSLIA